MADIRSERPESRHPKMNRQERAKQFAPYAALGRLDAVLSAVEEARDIGDPEKVPDLTDFESLGMFSESEEMEAFMDVDAGTPDGEM